MLEKLKPCPHCGGEAVFQDYHTAIDDKLFPNKDNSFWFIRCEKCQAGSWYYPTQAQAAAAWNTRDWLGQNTAEVQAVCKFVGAKSVRMEQEVKDTKDCPFCGDNEDLFIMFEDGLYWVECGCCGSQGGTAYSREGARRCWNMRERENDD